MSIMGEKITDVMDSIARTLKDHRGVDEFTIEMKVDKDYYKVKLYWKEGENLAAMNRQVPVDVSSMSRVDEIARSLDNCCRWIEDNAGRIDDAKGS